MATTEPGAKNRKIQTDCFIYQHPRILLGMKKLGFGTGKYNGFGGSVEEGETVEEAAKREVAEESGVIVSEIEKMGIIEFDFLYGPNIHEVHFFKATDFTGEPKESDEMKPEWFDIDTIPYDRMWPDDRYWLPLFLEGKQFKGRFLFGKDDAILEHELLLI